MTLASQPATRLHNPGFTSWDSDGAFYSGAFATLVKHYNHIKCYVVPLIVSSVEPSRGICALITSFHHFTAHWGVLRRLPSTWIGVWRLISHTWWRQPHLQFQFNNSPSVALGNSLHFPLLIFMQQGANIFLLLFPYFIHLYRGLAWTTCFVCSYQLPLIPVKLWVRGICLSTSSTEFFLPRRTEVLGNLPQFSTLKKD
jgi:hypothetical protein